MTSSNCAVFYYNYKSATSPRQIFLHNYPLKFTVKIGFFKMNFYAFLLKLEMCLVLCVIIFMSRACNTFWRSPRLCALQKLTNIQNTCSPAFGKEDDWRQVANQHFHYMFYCSLHMLHYSQKHKPWHKLWTTIHNIPTPLCTLCFGWHFSCKKWEKLYPLVAGKGNIFLT